MSGGQSLSLSGGGDNRKETGRANGLVKIKMLWRWKGSGIGAVSERYRSSVDSRRDNDELALVFSLGGKSSWHSVGKKREKGEKR